MNKKVVSYTLLCIALVFLSVSCIKKDIGNIEDNLVITPSYSVPIGSTDFKMETVVQSPNFETIPADSTTSSDSVFIYNDNRYYLNPGTHFDSTTTDFFDFSSLQEWIDNATLIQFRLNIENAIPADIIIQISFLDGNYNTLFSLFNEQGLTVPAKKDNNTILSPYDTDPLTVDEIQQLPNARYVESSVRIMIQSEASGALYYPLQFFYLQIGVRIDLERNIGE